MRTIRVGAKGKYAAADDTGRVFHGAGHVRRVFQTRGGEWN